MADDDQGDRGETQAERADRNWIDLLQEFRVLQTGLQLLSGFLLTLPFHASFKELDDFQRNTYLGLVVLAAVSTTLVLAPIAVHRRLFRLQRKERTVRVGHWVARMVLILVGALVTGTTAFIFDVVVDRASAMVVGSAVLVMALGSLIAFPVLAGRGRHQSPE